MPEVGSIQEALLLHVWLAQQKLKAQELRLLAQGLLDIASKNEKPDLDKLLLEAHAARFPFLEKDVSRESSELKKAMDREVAKGAIGFTPLEGGSPLSKALRKAGESNQQAKDLAKQVKEWRKK